MKLLRTITVAFIALSFTPTHAGEVKENYPDGKVKIRYTTDTKNQKIGPYEEFYPSGKPKLRGQYVAGKKSGAWIAYDEKGKVAESSTYRGDLLDGAYQWNLPSGKPGMHMTYRAGQIYGPILAEDDKGKSRRIVYTHSHEEIEKTMLALYFNDAPNEKFTTKPEVKAPYKIGALAPETLDTALKVLRMYRYLCGVPSDNLKVDPALSEKCGYTSVLHAKVGLGMSDKLEKPADMDPAFFKTALAANKDAIVHRANANPMKAIRSFMDDADEQSAATVMHRQWLLSPSLSKVGIGAAKNIVTMDISDGAKPAKSEFNYITFPAEGYFPKMLVDKQLPWSVFINGAKAKFAKAETIIVTLWKLDEHFQPQGDPIKTEILGTPAPADKAIAWNVLVFRPLDVTRFEPGRYWVDVDGVQTLAGSDVPFGYLVELIDVNLPQPVVVTTPTSAPAVPTADEKKKAKLETARSFLGKTVADLQFAGRRAKLKLIEDDKKTFQIDDPGEKTVILVVTGADDKIIQVTVDGEIVK